MLTLSQSTKNFRMDVVRIKFFKAALLTMFIVRKYDNNTIFTQSVGYSKNRSIKQITIIKKKKIDIDIISLFSLHQIVTNKIKNKMTYKRHKFQKHLSLFD